MRTFHRYRRFLKGVSVNATGKTGVILTTSSFISFLLFQFAWLVGLMQSAYIGLIAYLLFPLLFLIGLLLVPLGWQQFCRDKGKSSREILSETFDDRDLEKSFRGSRVIRIIGILTLVNVIFLMILSTQMVTFMDEPEFCGTACHTVMSPEWTTYQNSPHARVACVDCHVGEGVNAMFSAKLNGVRQMFLATFGTYNRPVPTPVHQLRPARETCEKCHWPDKFYGMKIKNIHSYRNDEASTPIVTTLGLKIDAGKSGVGTGIHWHISEVNEVRYFTADEKREEMIWVDVRQADGTFKRYRNRDFPAEENKVTRGERTLDCVDCHNRATHIYRDPESIVDELILSGVIDRSIPFVRREALAALNTNPGYESRAGNPAEIRLKRFYSRNYPEIAVSKSSELNRAAFALAKAQRENIFPHMKIEWGTYASHLDHKNGKGCFRCHNEKLVDDTGGIISNDCTLCHSILAYDDDKPFKYLQDINDKDPEAKMQKFLRDEFLRKE